MATSVATMHFEATLQQGEGWAFVLLPQDVSDALPSRGLVSVEGHLNGAEFLLVAWPDGQGGHWLKVCADLTQSAGVAPKDKVSVELAPTKRWPEPEVPEDLGVALAQAPKALEVWNSINTATRVDWIYWLDTSKKAETRTKRIEAACDMLAKGKKKVCCFDRSGIYSKALSCPMATPE